MGRTRPHLVVYVPAVALALAAAACSSSTSTSTHSGASGSNTAATASNPTVKAANSSTYGQILVNSGGMALYTYAPDQGHGGQSTCTGSCLQVWPALTVASGSKPTAGAGVTGQLASVKQSNGTYQVTYNGMPLYTFVSDTSAGQVTGNGVMSFTVAKVAASSSSSPAGSSPSTTAPSGGYGGY
jgi:predicted lipoprotein with Yx(FWY)xxD motif